MVLALGDVRPTAATALEPVEDGDPEVFVDVPDSLTPPALVLGWDNPWLEPRGMSACWFMARMAVICVAGRLEPGPGVAMLEDLVGYTVRRLADDQYQWGVSTAGAPREFPIGGVTYLAARLVYRVPVVT